MYKRNQIVKHLYRGPADEDEAGDGIQRTEDGDAVGTGNDRRLALMDTIANQHETEIADQLENVNDNDTTEPFVAPVEAEAAEEEPAAEEPAAVEEEPAPAPLPKIKVDGLDVELTPELIAKAQKIAKADKYLEEAAATRKGATAPNEPAPSPSLEDAAAAAEADDRALVRAIQVGNEEEALAAIRKIRNASQIPESKVAAIADERLEFKTALNWFEDEYKDLVADPILKSIVQSRDADLVAQGDGRSYRQRYEAIGNEVRDWVKERAKQFAPPPEPAAATSEARKEAKANAPKTPKPASGKAPEKRDTEEDGPEDTHSVIANMQKARGGPQWARA